MSSKQEKTPSLSELMRQHEEKEETLSERLIKIKPPIGSGTFGKVYLARDPTTNEMYAIKEINQRAPMERVRIEGAILEKIRRICNPFLLCLEEFKIMPTGNVAAILITKYIPNSYELAQLVKQQKFTVYMNFVIIEYLMLGLLILHNAGVAHRDIKPENIMVNTEGLIPTYIDFGLSCLGSDVDCMSTRAGTPDFMAPEIINIFNQGGLTTFEIAKKSDVWALGMTILDFCGFTLFYSNESSVNEYLELISEIPTTEKKEFEKFLKETEESTPEAKFYVDIVRPMLIPDYKKRCTIKEALNNLYKIVWNNRNILLRKTDNPRDAVKQMNQIGRQMAKSMVIRKGTKIMGVERDPRRKSVVITGRPGRYRIKTV